MSNSRKPINIRNMLNFQKLGTTKSSIQNDIEIAYGGAQRRSLERVLNPKN
jgi:hypothetical protein